MILLVDHPDKWSWIRHWQQRLGKYLNHLGDQMRGMLYKQRWKISLFKRSRCGRDRSIDRRPFHVQLRIKQLTNILASASAPFVALFIIFLDLASHLA